jgi:hypothetical protein
MAIHAKGDGTTGPPRSPPSAAPTLPGASGSKTGTGGKSCGDARVETVATPVQEADVIVLAVPWDAALAAIAACGDLTGRVPIDLTNPPFRSDGLELGLGWSISGAETDR